MKSEPVAVVPGDRSGVVDAQCHGEGRARDETRDTATPVANETMRPDPAEVKAGDGSRVVDALAHSDGSVVACIKKSMAGGNRFLCAQLPRMTNKVSSRD